MLPHTVPSGLSQSGEDYYKWQSLRCLWRVMSKADQRNGHLIGLWQKLSTVIILPFNAAALIVLCSCGVSL